MRPYSAASCVCVRTCKPQAGPIWGACFAQDNLCTQLGRIGDDVSARPFWVMPTKQKRACFFFLSSFSGQSVWVCPFFMDPLLWFGGEPKENRRVILGSTFYTQTWTRSRGSWCWSPTSRGGLLPVSQAMAGRKHQSDALRGWPPFFGGPPKWRKKVFLLASLKKQQQLKRQERHIHSAFNTRVCILAAFSRLVSEQAQLRAWVKSESQRSSSIQRVSCTLRPCLLCRIQRRPPA